MASDGGEHGKYRSGKMCLKGMIFDLGDEFSQLTECGMLWWERGMSTLPFDCDLIVCIAFFRNADHRHMCIQQFFGMHIHGTAAFI